LLIVLWMGFIIDQCIVDPVCLVFCSIALLHFSLVSAACTHLHAMLHEVKKNSKRVDRQHTYRYVGSDYKLVRHRNICRKVRGPRSVVLVHESHYTLTTDQDAEAKADTELRRKTMPERHSFCCPAYYNTRMHESIFPGNRDLARRLVR